MSPAQENEPLDEFYAGLDLALADEVPADFWYVGYDEDGVVHFGGPLWPPNYGGDLGLPRPLPREYPVGVRRACPCATCSRSREMNLEPRDPEFFEDGDLPAEELPDLWAVDLTEDTPVYQGVVGGERPKPRAYAPGVQTIVVKR